MLCDESSSGQDAPSDPPPSPTPIRVRGRLVGLVVGQTFRRHMRPEHYLRRPRAIAVDVEVLDQLDRLQVDVLEFIDVATGDTRATSRQTFLDRSFPLDRGFGRQRAMPLEAFHLVSVMQVPLPGLEALYGRFSGSGDE